MRMTSLVSVVFVLVCLCLVPFVSGGYPSTVNKALIAYSLGSGDVSFVKSNFDLVMGTYSSSIVTSLHSGSDIVVLAYKDMQYMSTGFSDWSTVAAHSEWFAHDSLGNFLFNPDWNDYVMNVSSSGWRAHVLAYCEARLAEGYDGVFLDDCWRDVGVYDGAFNGSLPSGYISGFLGSMNTFLDIFSGFDGLVVINSDEFTSDNFLSRSAVDGCMIEGFIHPNWLEPSEYSSYYSSLGDDLDRKVDTGKLVWAHSGCDPKTDAVAVGGVVENCYDAFRGNLSDFTDAYFGFGTYSDSDKGFYDVMDTVLYSEVPTATPVVTPRPWVSFAPTAVPPATASASMWDYGGVGGSALDVVLDSRVVVVGAFLLVCGWLCWLVYVRAKGG